MICSRLLIKFTVYCRTHPHSSNIMSPYLYLVDQVMVSSGDAESSRDVLILTDGRSGIDRGPLHSIIIKTGAHSDHISSWFAAFSSSNEAHSASASIMSGSCSAKSPLLPVELHNPLASISPFTSLGRLLPRPGLQHLKNDRPLISKIFQTGRRHSHGCSTLPVPSRHPAPCKALTGVLRPSDDHTVCWSFSLFAHYLLIISQI